MSRYGVSLDVGADMEKEKAHEEAMRKQAEEEAVPSAKAALAKPTVDDDAPVIKAQWFYIFGAVAFIILMILLLSWGNSSTPVQLQLSDELANADSNTVAAAIGDKGPTAPAAVNASNHTNESS